MSDFWTLAGVNPYGQPSKGVAAVRADAAKIGRYLDGGVCRSGFVIVFEEADSGFGEDFASVIESETAVASASFAVGPDDAV